MNGIINVYKPQGMSSNSAVILIKKLLGIKKVGHTGTLDPLACGVLPICIGNATKISDYLMNKTKGYRVKLRFGIFTDTYDCEGKIIKEDPNVSLNEDEVINILKSFVGEQLQVPPKYSALKVNGVRAYELARSGEDVKLEPRKINIYFIEDISFKDNECSFYVECSKGTYIRSLCVDIGEKLNTFATMTFLERTKSGQFTKDTSINVKDLTKDKIEKSIIKIDEVLNLPKLSIDDPNIIKLLRNGVCVKNPRYIRGISLGEYLLYNDFELIGISLRKGDYLKVIKFLG